MPQRVRVAVAKPLLDLTMPDSARRVTQSQFDRWCLQSRELAAGTNPDALHDYRTSVRRLRTLLRILRPWLPDLSRGSRRRLRDLMQATGPARNLEVLQGWVQHHLAALTPRQRSGARWLSRRLEYQLARAHRAMGRQLARKGPKAETRIRRELSSAIKIVSGAPVAGLVLRRLIRQETAVLNRRLSAIESMADGALIHRARIAAKRLRYLMEPFAGELPDGAALLERLGELQDLVGAITDTQVAAAELRDALVVASARRAGRLGQALLPWSTKDTDHSDAPQPPTGAQTGLAALARILRGEGDGKFERLLAWLEEPKVTLVRLLRKAGTVSRGGRI